MRPEQTTLPPEVNDFTIERMVSFVRDQSPETSQDWLNGYAIGLKKMRSLMLDIIEKEREKHI